jgi:hypothetical protein
MSIINKKPRTYKKQQDDRLLKRLNTPDRRIQEQLRKLISDDQIFSTI